MREKYIRLVVSALAVALVLALGVSALSNAVAKAADTGIAINEVNFPDPVFRAYVSAPQIDKNLDGVLSVGEIVEVTNISVVYSEIASLQGLEFFAALERLECYWNKLTELDVGKNINLIWLDCEGNQLTKLDVRKNTSLTWLYCDSNQLTTLDISKNIYIKNLDCSSNKLTALDVSNNINLTSLNCYGNQLSALDIQKNINLTYLNCGGNQLKTLDISKNIYLTELSCNRNQLAELDVSKNINLINLYCYDNPLTVAGWLPFMDVPKNDWFFDDVHYTFNNNLMSGINIHTFSPNLPATRTVLVNAIYRHAKSVNLIDFGGVSSQFSDVEDYAPYSEAVIWAAANGIVNGRGDGTFAPEGSITRQDLAVIFLRYMKYAEISIPRAQEYIMFADEAQISDYAKAAVQTLHKLGIIQGVGGNTIDPKGMVTRAQLAAMLRRFIELAE
jgi:hypothetical protein